MWNYFFLGPYDLENGGIESIFRSINSTAGFGAFLAES
jgi:hypothetical protein